MAQAGIGNLGGGLGKFTELRQRLLFVIGALIDFGSAEHEGGLLAQAEDGVLELHGISDVGGAEIGRKEQRRFRFSNASI